MYQVLYRTWSPKRFDEVIGQDVIIRTLKRQVASRRIAHAYLFCGSRGTGKTTTARIMARAANCAELLDGEPCGDCASCVALQDEGSLDVWEMDAASNNGVDEVRDLREKIKYPPAVGRYRVVILDEVHMLSGGAFNALLKTLEEPPEHALFILCTTEPQRLPPTIVSRCQRFDFLRVSAEIISERLALVLAAMEVPAEPEALAMIARAATGGVRDALSLLDVALGFAQGTLTAEVVRDVLGVPDDAFFASLLDALIDHDGGAALCRADEWLRGGRDAVVLLRALAAHVRDVLVAAQVERAYELLEISREAAQALADRAQRMPLETWLRWLDIFARGESDLRFATAPRVLLDLCLMRAAHPETPIERAPIEERVARLEALYERGAPAQAAHRDEGAPSEASGKASASAAPRTAAPKRAAKAVSPISGDASAEELWRKLLASVRAQPAGMGRYALLTRGTPASWEGGVLTIGFTQKDRSAYDVASGDASRKGLEELLAAETGQEAHISFLLEGEAKATPPAGASLLEQASEIFGRGIIVVEEEDA